VLYSAPIETRIDDAKRRINTTKRSIIAIFEITCSLRLYLFLDLAQTRLFFYLLDLSPNVTIVAGLGNLLFEPLRAGVACLRQTRWTQILVETRNAVGCPRLTYLLTKPDKQHVDLRPQLKGDPILQDRHSSSHMRKERADYTAPNDNLLKNQANILKTVQIAKSPAMQSAYPLVPVF
jgi:hypothetical protein